ncbi:MAG: SMI1/KNR4 family protein [Pirellulales bacterium]
MSYEDDLERISEWVKQSRGNPVVMPSGSRRWFVVSKVFAENEVDQVERKWGIKLPSSYRLFLLRVGAGVFFADASNLQSGFEVRGIDFILDEVATITDGITTGLFSHCIPVGLDRSCKLGLILALSDAVRGHIYSVELPGRWDGLKLTEHTGVPFAEWLSARVADA